MPAWPRPRSRPDTLAAGPASAGVDGDVVLGASNSETNPTAIINTAAATDAFRAFSATSGTAIFGSSPTGFGVHGKSAGTATPRTRGQNTGSGPGVSGDSVDGNGVIGTSVHANGVSGLSTSSGTGVSGQSQGGAGVGGGSTDGSGVFGVSTNSDGVSGLSTNGEGVVGIGPGSGVRGTCAILSGTGVLAQNVAGGDALRVTGRSTFDRSGLATVLAGQKTVTVAGVALTAASLVLATIQASPGRALIQSAIPNVGASSFDVNLSKPAPSNLPVAWFIVN